jgi:hypothetical protein
MKSRLLLIVAAIAAVAGLTGCYAYGGGPYGAGYYNDGGYASGGYATQPYVYGYGGSYRYYDRGYDNRYSGRRDRDGDGVPNWRDARPDNPYRR